MKKLLRIDPDLKAFLIDHFDLTPEEMAQTSVSYEEFADRVSIHVDFGEGLKTNPHRTARMVELLGITTSGGVGPCIRNAQTVAIEA